MENRIDKWFRDRADIKEKYKGKWVLVNIERNGVSIVGKDCVDLMDRCNAYEGKFLNKGQSMRDLYIVQV